MEAVGIDYFGDSLLTNALEHLKTCYTGKLHSRLPLKSTSLTIQSKTQREQSDPKTIC